MLHRLRGLLGPDLAIDLGTANTLISVAGEGLVLNEPSVVAVEEGTHRIVAGGCAVGRLAKQMQGRTPGSVTVVRPLREGVITDFELCEAMLRYFIRKVRRHGWGLKPRALVAVPGCITQVEKRAVYNSAHRAGARQVLLMTEAKAAAIGVGLPVSEPVASMICDIGGGTTEVAVMSMSDVVAAESVRVGGDALDLAIVDYLRRHYSLRIGLTMAEKLRVEIGSAYPLEAELVDEVRGVDSISGLPRKATITSEEVREALGDPLARIIETIKSVLDRCSPDLAADLVDNGLVLAGGGALTRGIDRFITEQTGLPARVADNALSAVAKGAQSVWSTSANGAKRWSRAMTMFDYGPSSKSRDSGYMPNRGYTPNRGSMPVRSSIPPLGLMAMLLAATIAMFLPVSQAAALKGTAARLFLPGQRQFARARDWTLHQVELLSSARAISERQSLLAEELRRLKSRNCELEAAFALSRLEHDAPPPDGIPLLLAELVPARVLGRQARVFLQRTDLIDRGGNSGLFTGDLAIAGGGALKDEMPQIDQGADGALAVDDLALAGRRVWGRLSEVGPRTASVRRMTDVGFREVAQVAHWDNARWRATARGVLEGTGEPLARMRMVATTEPVSVGDYVLATSVDGAVSAPLIYGCVARVERGAGKTHWDIWIEPAVGPDEPGIVSVLRLSLNPKRAGALDAKEMR